MATVFKRPDSQYYYTKFRHKGATICVSTGMKDKKDALVFLRNKLAEVKQGQSLSDMFDKVLSRLAQLKDEDERDAKREEFVERLLSGKQTRLAFTDAFDMFQKTPRKTKPGEQLLRIYNAWFTEFTDWLAEKYPAVEYLDQIAGERGQRIAGQYTACLNELKQTPRTYNGKVQFLRLIFRVCKLEAGLRDNVWDAIELKLSNRQGRRQLEPEELAVVCATATGVMKYWLALGLYTGLRLKDVVLLKWDEVDLKKGFITRVPSKTRTRTNGSAVKIPIHPTLHAMLKQHRLECDGNGCLFPDEAKLYHERPHIIGAMIQSHFTSCGIKTTEAATGERQLPIVRVGFHSLRHSFISMCESNHVPRAAIMDMAGHGSLAVNDLYAHANEQDKTDAIASLPEVIFNEK